VAGVAFQDMDLQFAWQAWHVVAAAVGVAGVALGDIGLHFAWQA